MAHTFGQFINKSSYFWRNFHNEDTMAIELLKRLYNKVYEDVCRPVLGSEPNEVASKWFAAIMVTETTEHRTLFMLMSRPIPVLNSFTMETIVVRDDSAFVDLDAQFEGVVPFLTTP